MRFICLVIAAVMLAASIAVIYPSIINDYSGNVDLPEQLTSITEDHYILDAMGFENFPFYTQVKEICTEYIPVVNGETDKMPAFSELVSEAASQDGSLQTLYSFLIIALCSIPVYMIVRLIPYNTIYRMTDDAFILARPLARGIAACTCSITSVTVTWFLYNTLIYEKLYTAALEWINSYTKPEIALNVTNLLIIIVGVIAVIGLLKMTIFRGSFINSILTAVLRNVLFVVIFAAANTFFACDTVRVLLLCTAFVCVIGILDMIIEPSKRR